MQESKPSSFKNSEPESDIILPLNENPGSKSDDVARFNNSLQELRDLRSQLHYAADYCEKTFVKAKEKKMVMENTKEYICRAMVTVVDHLGSVSAHLEGRISTDYAISESELRMDCLKQRLLTCQQYAQSLALSKVRWSDNFPRYNSHYISRPTGNLEISKSNGILRNFDDSIAPRTMMKYKIDSNGEIPVFMHINPHKPLLATLSAESDTGVKKSRTSSKPGFNVFTMLPTRATPQGYSQSKPQNPYFSFQDTSNMVGRKEQTCRRSLIIGRAKKYKHIDLYFSNVEPQMKRIKRLNQAMTSASHALDLYDVFDCKSIASHIKKEFDMIYGSSGWQCIVGSNFGCFFTHSKGTFIYFTLETLNFLIFKGACSSSSTA